MIRNVHKPGRPAEPMSITDARDLLAEYQTKSPRQLAKKYNVSQTTICKRLKKARTRMGVEYGREETTQETESV